MSRDKLSQVGLNQTEVNQVKGTKLEKRLIETRLVASTQRRPGWTKPNRFETQQVALNQSEPTQREINWLLENDQRKESPVLLAFNSHKTNHFFWRNGNINFSLYIITPLYHHRVHFPTQISCARIFSAEDARAVMVWHLICSTNESRMCDGIQSALKWRLQLCKEWCIAAGMPLCNVPRVPSSLPKM